MESKGLEYIVLLFLTLALPQTILKQLEEWHVIVSCDQLGETLRAASTLPLFFQLFSHFKYEINGGITLRKSHKRLTRLTDYP